MQRRSFLRCVAATPISLVLAKDIAVTGTGAATWLAAQAPKRSDSIRRASAEAQGPMRWVFPPLTVEVLAADPVVSKSLEGTQPFVITRLNKAAAAPAAWNAIPIVSFKSFAEIKEAFEQHLLQSGVKGIIYDNERWDLTPEAEQRNPAYYAKLSAEQAHGHGLLFVTAPGVSLVPVLAPESRMKRHDEYLRLGLAADAARYADVIDIQAQAVASDTELYANFVHQAAEQARQANPKVIVVAGLSTNPGGRHMTADELLRAIAATRDAADGYWLNIPRSGEQCPQCEFRPDIAIEVLRTLAGS